jgi:MFS family permease
MTRTAARSPGILSRPYALTTAGSWSLIFLAAFESLAVTTIMPVITADLHGRSLYSLGFAATMAAGVVGMVVAGSWADGRGPATPLAVSIGLFAAGLAIAGTAPAMTIFVVGRFLQGLGAGGITVALYVLIAKLFPADLHIKIFGAFASAWVLPSLVGPFVAGVVADALSWHWVFLGVLVMVGIAAAMIAPVLRAAPPRSGPARAKSPQTDKTQGETKPREGQPPHSDGSSQGSRAGSARRMLAATTVALGVVALSSTAQLSPHLTPIIAPIGVVVVALAARTLLPSGTYTARPGLPAMILICASAGAVFFGTEVYLPLLLHDRYGLPAWLSGLTLTAAAIAWALASAVQSRIGTKRGALRLGALLLAAGAITELLVAATHPPAAIAAVGWFLAGAGMGTLYPQISTLVLARSEPGREGFNTAAKSIADAVGGSVSLALGGLLFGALGDSTSAAPYLGVLSFTSVVALITVALAGRSGQ